MTLCSDMVFSLDSMVNSAQTGFSFGADLVAFWCFLPGFADFL